MVAVCRPCGLDGQVRGAGAGAWVGWWWSEVIGQRLGGHQHLTPWPGSELLRLLRLHIQLRGAVGGVHSQAASASLPTHPHSPSQGIVVVSIVKHVGIDVVVVVADGGSIDVVSFISVDGLQSGLAYLWLAVRDALRVSVDLGLAQVAAAAAAAAGFPAQCITTLVVWLPLLISHSGFSAVTKNQTGEEEESLEDTVKGLSAKVNTHRNQVRQQK